MNPWQIPSAEPVIAPGQLHGKLDARRAGAAHVQVWDGHFQMVYWATDEDGNHHILRARAPLDHPMAWEAVGGPLISHQPETQHNCQGPGFPFLLRVTDELWHLYFCAWGRRPDGKLPNTTCLAVSEDAGETWRYHHEYPIIAMNRPFDAEGTGSLWVLLEAGRFRMYYTGLGRYKDRPEGVETGHGDTIPEIGIAYAESSDGIHWEKPCDDWLVKPRGFGVAPYEYIASKPCIVATESGYVMWVNTFGTAYRVHRLTSTNGSQWDWAPRVGPEGEFGHGDPGSFDDHQRSYPCMVLVDDTLHCWYTGNGFGVTGMGYAHSKLC